MLKQHTMELVYINDESNESSTELVFYLRHNKGTDTKTDVFAVRNKAYDVKQIMSDFKGKHGSYPTTIRIKAKPIWMVLNCLRSIQIIQLKILNGILQVNNN